MPVSDITYIQIVTPSFVISEWKLVFKNQSRQLHASAQHLLVPVMQGQL